MMQDLSNCSIYMQSKWEKEPLSAVLKAGILTGEGMIKMVCVATVDEWLSPWQQR